MKDIIRVSVCCTRREAGGFLVLLTLLQLYWDAVTGPPADNNKNKLHSNTKDKGVKGAYEKRKSDSVSVFTLFPP